MKKTNTLPESVINEKYYRDSQAIGTEAYNFMYPKMALTDGVKAAFEKLQSFWVGDIIWSYFPIFKKADGLCSVHIVVTGMTEGKATGGAKVYISDGNYNILQTQDIPYTDLTENLHLFCSFQDDDLIVMLTSEY